MVLAIDSPLTGGVTLTQVHARFFHVDFATPANSTFGVGADHTPNAEITVDPFVDAFTVPLALRSCRSRERPTNRYPWAIKS